MHSIDSTFWSSGCKMATIELLIEYLLGFFSHAVMLGRRMKRLGKVEHHCLSVVLLPWPLSTFVIIGYTPRGSDKLER